MTTAGRMSAFALRAVRDAVLGRWHRSGIPAPVVPTPAHFAARSGDAGGSGAIRIAIARPRATFGRIDGLHMNTIPGRPISRALPLALAALLPPSASMAQCFGDLNRDHAVNGADLGLLQGAWDTPGPLVGDLSRSPRWQLQRCSHERLRLGAKRRAASGGH